MADQLHCQLVTPTNKLLESSIAYASIPAWDGLFGVLPGHAPLVAELGLGELRIEFTKEDGGGDRSYLLDGGFVKVDHHGITILAEHAVPAETLSETDAKAQLAEAEARTVPDDATDRAAEAEKIAHERNRARLAIRLAQTAKSRGI